MFFILIAIIYIMAFISDNEIEELQKTLTTREAAQEILDNFCSLLHDSFEIVPHPNAYTRREDRVSAALLSMTGEFRSWKPVNATANGNCLFNSASIVLTGNESLSGILRLLTVAELFAHSEFYANHPQISQFSQACIYSSSAIFNIFLSDDSATGVYKGNQENARLAIEVLAKATAKPYIFSSQFHILALASVIRMPIFSVYPDIPGMSAIRNAMHGVCYPRQMLVDGLTSCQQVDRIHIMWTTAAQKQMRGWRPNHFVPLLIRPNDQGESVPEFLSYAPEVRGGRKRPAQQSPYPKEDKKVQQSFQAKTSPPKIAPVIKVDDANCKQEDKNSPPRKTQQKHDIKLTQVKQQKLTSYTSSQKLSKPAPHGRGKLKHSERTNPLSIPKRIKIKKNKEKIVKDVSSTKAAKSPTISSFFKQADRPKDHEEQPRNIPKPSIYARNDKEQESEELFPLSGPRIEWYKEKGRNACTNISRSTEAGNINVTDDEAPQLVLGSTSGTIKENIKALLQKLGEGGSKNQQQHLEAMVTLGEYLIENGPIVATQEMAKKYKEVKGLVSQRVRSSRIIRSMSKHLNIAQIYVHGNGFVIENHGKQLLHLLGCIKKENNKDDSIIKEKVLEVIGKDFKDICEYLDSKRDRDTR